MSRTRQSGLRRNEGTFVAWPDGSVIVRTHPVTYAPDVVLPSHRHDWDQLTYASRGVISVHTASGIWVAPPHRAVWVPARMEHSEEMSGRVSVRTLYFVPGVLKDLPDDCRAVNVSPLLRELILHVSRIGVLDSAKLAHKRLFAVIRDQMTELSAVPLQLPMPADPRALKLTDLLRQESAKLLTLSQLARRVGASQRTLERIFLNQTKMTLRVWRRRFRLLEALRRLAAGEAVTTVALDCGYQSSSAFIAMFRREMGATPGSYYRNMSTSA